MGQLHFIKTRFHQKAASFDLILWRLLFSRINWLSLMAISILLENLHEAMHLEIYSASTMASPSPDVGAGGGGFIWFASSTVRRTLWRAVWSIGWPMILKNCFTC